MAVPPTATTVDTGEDDEDATVDVAESVLAVDGLMGADETDPELTGAATDDEVDTTALTEGLSDVGVVGGVVEITDAAGDDVTVGAVVGTTVPAVFS